MISNINAFLQLLSVFSPNTGKYGPEKTPYLDTSRDASENLKVF